MLLYIAEIWNAFLTGCAAMWWVLLLQPQDPLHELQLQWVWRAAGGGESQFPQLLLWRQRASLVRCLWCRRLAKTTAPNRESLHWPGQSGYSDQAQDWKTRQRRYGQLGEERGINQYNFCRVHMSANVKGSGGIGQAWVGIAQKSMFYSSTHDR